jgi:mono/diheme cytochrome c family protein
VNLDGKRKQNLALAPITDADARHRQLPGELMVAALPEATPEYAFMKKIFTNNCTACHTPSYSRPRPSARKAPLHFPANRYASWCRPRPAAAPTSSRAC